MNTARKIVFGMTNVARSARGSVTTILWLTDAGENEVFYQSVLKENAQEYEKVIQEYSDRG